METFCDDKLARFFFKVIILKIKVKSFIIIINCFVRPIFCSQMRDMRHRIGQMSGNSFFFRTVIALKFVK